MNALFFPQMFTAAGENTITHTPDNRSLLISTELYSEQKYIIDLFFLYPLCDIIK